MGLFRLIFLGLIVWLIYRVVRALTGAAEQTAARRSQHSPPRTAGTEGKPSDEPATNRMVRCAECGLHVPFDEAVRDGDRYFCSTEHRDRDRDRQRRS